MPHLVGKLLNEHIKLGIFRQNLADPVIALISDRPIAEKVLQQVGRAYDPFLFLRASLIEIVDVDDPLGFDRLADLDLVDQ